MASLTNRHIKDTYQDLLTTENNLLQSGLGDPVEVNMSGSSFISASISGDGFNLGSGSDNTVLSSSFAQTAAANSDRIRRNGKADGCSPKGKDEQIRPSLS